MLKIVELILVIGLLVVKTLSASPLVEMNTASNNYQLIVQPASSAGIGHSQQHQNGQRNPSVGKTHCADRRVRSR